MTNEWEANLRLLEKRGDPLEQLILRTARDPESFDQILYQYASVWTHHVFARRLPNNPSRVPDEWMRFAGSHYTSLFRAYSAWRKLPEIQNVCRQFADKKGDAESLFQVHDVTASFWWNLGASIDNLLRAADDAPPLKKGAIRREDHKELADAYNYRSQYIHSRLVVGAPDTDGLLHFNLELLEGHGADWSLGKYRAEYYEDFYPKAWKDFCQSATQAWAKLGSLLLEYDDDRTVLNVEEVLLIEPVGRFDFRGTSPISNVTIEEYSPEYFSMLPSGVSPPSGTR